MRVFLKWCNSQVDKTVSFFERFFSLHWSFPASQWCLYCKKTEKKIHQGGSTTCHCYSSQWFFSHSILLLFCYRNSLNLGGCAVLNQMGTSCVAQWHRMCLEMNILKWTLSKEQNILLFCWKYKVSNYFSWRTFYLWMKYAPCDISKQKCCSH